MISHYLWWQDNDDGTSQSPETLAGDGAHHPVLHCALWQRMFRRKVSWRRCWCSRKGLLGGKDDKFRDRVIQGRFPQQQTRVT